MLPNRLIVVRCEPGLRPHEQQVAVHLEIEVAILEAPQHAQRGDRVL